MPQDARTAGTAVLTFAPRASRAPVAGSPADPDLDLLRRIGDGDSEALGTLYDRHAGLALALLQRMLGENGEAEEVLQEVFLQVWRDARRYDPARSSPRGWLLLLARSRALDRLRATSARQRREEIVSRQEAGLAVAPLGSRRLEHLDQRRHVSSALARLPVEQRRVLELSFFHGLSQTEIASRLGAPLGTIKSRALMGMKKLRQILGEGREGADRISEAC